MFTFSKSLYKKKKVHIYIFSRLFRLPNRRGAVNYSSNTYYNFVFIYIIFIKLYTSVKCKYVLPIVRFSEKST